MAQNLQFTVQNNTKFRIAKTYRVSGYTVQTSSSNQWSKSRKKKNICAHEMQKMNQDIYRVPFSSCWKRNDQRDIQNSSSITLLQKEIHEPINRNKKQL